MNRRLEQASAISFWEFRPRLLKRIAIVRLGRVITLVAQAGLGMFVSEASLVRAADTTPPSVSITAPAKGANLANAVVISAAATDNVAIAQVQFQIDNMDLGFPVFTPPYVVTWNSSSEANGSHTIRALASDTSGNRTISAAVTVTVSNLVPNDVVVTTVSQLVTAVNSAKPGQRIVIAPGTYVLTDRLRFGSTNSGTSAAPVTVMSQSGPASVTINANGVEEHFYFRSGARYVIVRGLTLTGGAYHAVKIDFTCSDITILGNIMFDNTRGPGLSSQFSAIRGGGATGAPYASRVTIEGNEISQRTPFSGNNFQGIACNACKDWVVRRNRFFNIRGAPFAGAAIQFKSGSAGTVIENNIVRNCGLVGINYGGFGTPAWGGETYEHVGGIVRNNIVSGCADAGISVIKNKDGKVFNNTLYNNGYTPDVRVSALNVQYRNNILDRPLRLRDGTTVSSSNNLVLISPTDGSLFLIASLNNFRLKPTATAAINRGADLRVYVPWDFDFQPRPSGSALDIGFDEFRP